MPLFLFLIRFFQTTTGVVFKTFLAFSGSINISLTHRIDPKKPVLIIANHSSYADSYGVFFGMRFWDAWNLLSPLRYMTGANIYYSLLLPILFLGGCFPTRKWHRKHYSPVQTSIDYLRQGQTVVIFPEGKRVRSSPVEPRNGVVRIINGCDFPIQIVLVHMIWRRKGWRLYGDIRYGRCHDTSSAKSIMEQIYSL